MVAILLMLLGVGGVAADEPAEVWVESIRGPQYFALYVEDVDRSVDWYRSVFGLRRVSGSVADDDSWRIENLGNDQLLVEIIRDSRAKSVERALGFRKVGFHVADVEKVADRIERASGERPPIVDFGELRQRILQIRDPDGNTIQLMSPLDGN